MVSRKQIYRARLVKRQQIQASNNSNWLWLSQVKDRLSWVMDGEDSWIFGPLVRGYPRPVLASVYFYEGTGRDYGWRWIILPIRKNQQPIRGMLNSLRETINTVEEKLGLIKDCSCDPQSAEESYQCPKCGGWQYQNI